VKKIKYIFVFIFLTGMIYTVFQYVPILEEEAQNHGIELAKKGTEDNSSDGDGDEIDSDSADAIYDHLNFNFASLYSKTHLFKSSVDDYNSFFQKITIPPPKA